MRYHIYWTNHFYWDAGYFEVLEEAKERCRKVGFEATVWQWDEVLDVPKEPVMLYSPINGFTGRIS
jgi:hypothetical protein